MHMIAVAAEILRRELPIARHDPFVHAADHLDTALAAVEERVEIPAHLAEILGERRCFEVEGGEVQTFVIVELRYGHEAPLLPIEFVVIGLFQIRDADQLAVIPVGPAVVGAGEAGGIAVIGAAQPVAAMAAHIEESANRTGRVAHDQYRVFAHVRREEIAGPRDLALMAQEDPAAREDAFELLLIDLRLDEDAAADMPGGEIDEPICIGLHGSLRIQRGRGMRNIAPASTVMMLPVMPRASRRDARKR